MISGIESKSRGLLLLIGGSVLLNGLILLLDDRVARCGAGREPMRRFQKAAGGLGMGATPVPSWNEMDFDPRLQPVVDSDLWPVPGCYDYSPSRMVTTFSERALIRSEAAVKHHPEGDG